MESNNDDGEAWVVEVVKVCALLIDEHPASVIVQATAIHACRSDICASACFDGIDANMAEKHIGHGDVPYRRFVFILRNFGYPGKIFYTLIPMYHAHSNFRGPWV